MTSPMTYRLHYAPDNASLIVRLALDSLGLAYETRLVDRGRKEQKGAAYLRLNPHGRIPTLETPDGAMSETGAILLWLGDRHRGQDYVLGPGPGDAGRGDYLKWLFAVSNTLHSHLISIFYTHRYTGPGPEVQAQMRRQTIRQSSGQDVDGACGQLRARAQ